MTKKKRKIDFGYFKIALPYIVIGLATISIAFFGSLDKRNSDMNLSLDAFAKTNYKISVDQLSAMYVVADISDSFNLASASDVASNFVVTTSMYGAGQTSTGKLEKPNITNINVSRGVIKHIVSEGETMASIAAKYSITTDNIRWSNGKKTADVSVGDILYLPSVNGIVYTVKSGDTIDGIASKYGSSVNEIIALNDLEVSGIADGMRILIKGGTLPEKERPEYVAPVVYYSYSYSGSAYSRQNIEILGNYYGLGGPYVAGQCTQWVWYKRQDMPSNLGNANTWAVRAAAAGYTVNRTPTVGSIFQTNVGWYGHVGYVEAVNADGSITVTEMNYNYRAYQVIRAVIPANAVGNFYFIH